MRCQRKINKQHIKAASHMLTDIFDIKCLYFTILYAIIQDDFCAQHECRHLRESMVIKKLLYDLRIPKKKCPLEKTYL